MRRRTIAVCKTCNQTKYVKSRGRGLCDACDIYKIRHGTPRPSKLYNRNTAFCRWCKEKFVYALGLCSACYEYDDRGNEYERPPHLYNRHSSLCKNPNCKKPLWIDKQPIKGTCILCYKYNDKYDILRPLHVCRLLPDKSHPYICKNPNCDKPLERDNGSRRGFCTKCYNWNLDHSSDRPYEICYRKIGLGWCDCGNVAVETITVKNRLMRKKGTITIDMNLCLECYKLETEEEYGVH